MFTSPRCCVSLPPACVLPPHYDWLLPEPSSPADNHLISKSWWVCDCFSNQLTLWLWFAHCSVSEHLPATQLIKTCRQRRGPGSEGGTLMPKARKGCGFICKIGNYCNLQIFRRHVCRLCDSISLLRKWNGSPFLSTGACPLDFSNCGGRHLRGERWDMLWGKQFFQEPKYSHTAKSPFTQCSFRHKGVF